MSTRWNGLDGFEVGNVEGGEKVGKTWIRIFIIVKYKLNITSFPALLLVTIAPRCVPSIWQVELFQGQHSILSLTGLRRPLLIQDTSFHSKVSRELKSHEGYHSMICGTLPYCTYY
jgi:hypothetical protein